MSGPAALAALLAACGSGLPKPDPQRPDIVLLSIDTLRADHLSSWGYPRPTSPNLDQLAAGGVRFSHARSPSPWTLPAHTTMLTGQTPTRHHVVEDDLRLDPATPVLPELLRAAGYATGGFVATMFVSRVFGFERGFDHFEDYGISTARRNAKTEVSATRVFDSALEWVRDQPDGKPIFLFLHVYDVHYDYDPPAPWDTRFDRAPRKGDARYKTYGRHKRTPLAPRQMEHQVAQYDEAIAYVDHELGRLSGALRDRPVRWVITADHGEEFGERGSWGHAHTLYAEQLHVPLVMAGPGLPQGRVVDEVVGLQDLAPTLAAWAGATGLQAEGLDLAPALDGRPLPQRAFLAETSRFKSNRLSLLEGGLRLEWDLRGEAELYAPAEDPDEMHDLAGERPADVARLQARIEALLGAPWEIVRAGRVEAEGVILAGGVRDSLEGPPGTRFLALPYDARLRWQAGEERRGPWALAGAGPPEPDAPLRLHTSAAPAAVDLDAAQREQLEALGYVQEEPR